MNLTNLGTMTHTDVDKHAWSADAKTMNVVARKRKIFAIFQVTWEGTTRIRAR